jgi:hypothetical protein
MGNFMGGSAFSMAGQVSEGYLLLNAHHLKRMGPNEIHEFKFEIEKLLNEIRGDQPPLHELDLLRKRNRRISRLNNALLVVNTHLQLLKRPGAKPTQL